MAKGGNQGMAKRASEERLAHLLMLEAEAWWRKHENREF